MTKPAPVVARADASMALLEYPSGAAQLSGTASAGDLWRILWHRRLMVLSISCALFVTVLVYCLAVTPLYTATSEILIDPRDRLVFSNDVNPTGIAADGGITQIESQARVIESS